MTSGTDGTSQTTGETLELSGMAAPKRAGISRKNVGKFSQP